MNGNLTKVAIGLGVLALAGVLFGTAWAEDIHYTGDDLPLRINVNQGDTLYFVATDKIPNLWTGIPTNCENIVAEGKCFIEFTERYTVGQWNWESKSGVSGKFQVNPAPVEATADNSYENVSQQAKDFKAQIEAKMNEKLAPYKAKIAELERQLSNSEEREVLMNNQINTLKSELTTAQGNAVLAQAQTEKLTEANSTIEQYKKDADNWKAVALEQLRVMAEVLGLF